MPDAIIDGVGNGYPVGVNAVNELLSNTKNFIVKVEQASSTITYVGKAAIGSSVSDSVWQILRIDTGTLAADVGWANSEESFDKVWNSRAGYTYG